VRAVCKHCQEQVVVEQPVVDGDEVVIPTGASIVRPRGCPKCMRTGYKGRTGIFEVIIVDDDMRELVKAKASPRDYRQLLQKRGLTSLRRVGLDLVRAGITTVDEVVRVTT
jgi:general secretion pathway protein E/type IV pilus assembly protein PilB